MYGAYIPVGEVQTPQLHVSLDSNQPNVMNKNMDNDDTEENLKYKFDYSILDGWNAWFIDERCFFVAKN